jgi:hypothetical protein
MTTETFNAYAPIGGNMDAPGAGLRQATTAPVPSSEPKPIPENDISVMGKAIRQIEAWKRDPVFQKALLANDANAVAALKQAHREAREPVDTYYGGAVVGVPEDRTPEELDRTTAAIASRTLFNPAELDEIRQLSEGTLRLDPAEIRWAHAHYAARRSDPEWCRRSMIAGTPQYTDRMRLVAMRAALPRIEE